MVLTRATNIAVQAGADGNLSTADDVHFHNNQTTPFVDQNQTYTSHPSHQVFLREYVLVDRPDDDIAGPVPVDTGQLLEGTAAALATWADIKAQARDVLGIELDRSRHPQYAAAGNRSYGNFIPGRERFSSAGNTRWARRRRSRCPGLKPPMAIRTNHAFLDDIAHKANPEQCLRSRWSGLVTWRTVGRGRSDDEVNEAPIATDFRGRKMAYDDELLDATSSPATAAATKTSVSLRSTTSSTPSTTGWSNTSRMSHSHRTMSHS